MSRRLLLCLLMVLLLPACNRSEAPGTVASPQPGVLAPQQTPDLASNPALAARATAVIASLQQPIPVLRRERLDQDAQRAQELALAAPNVQAAFRAQDGSPLRNEVFQSRPASVGDIPAGVSCGSCYRVEIYHYATNSVTTALVDLAGGRVVDVQNTPNSQPEVPKELADLAVQIAITAPEVREALGVAPEAAEALMPQMKTALNQTRCERAQHLCVAPTFRQNDRMLWAVVDLTDLRLVGVQWTELGASGQSVTAKTIENSAISTEYCERDTKLERNGWSLRYRLTGSDGLEVRDATFNGRPVFQSLKLVDWHVSYSGEQQFGYSDATGCPLFSAAAVPSYEPPDVEDITRDGQVVGFALIQDFRHPAWPQPCNYFYSQRTEFFADGNVRPLAVSLGRGCGTEGTYRPVFRIAMAGEGWGAALWDGSGWAPLAQEALRSQRDATLAPDGGWLRLSNSDGRGFVLAPGRGGTPEERGDQAYLYVTQTKTAEGDTDLPTIGSCCNADERQGPEVFVNNEPLAGAPLTVWYVAQLFNEATSGSEYCWADTVVEQGVYVPRAWACQGGPFLNSAAGGTP
ncbi:MAG: hypothetical protein OHK0022_06900 [Roseiflexaceae bacterium]